MARTARLSAALLVAIAALLIGAFLTAPVPATATPDAPVPSPSTAPVPLPVTPTADPYGDGDTSLVGDGPAVPSDGGGDMPAVRLVPGTVPSGAEDSPAPGAEPADSGPAVPADGDEFDPAADALPADAPRVCVLLDMGAAACDSFVHPAPGQVSVAVIYSDDDEHAIVETIAYDEHGPIDYVDFWEGTTTPSE